MKKGIVIALFVLYCLISIMFFRIIAVFAGFLYWKRKQRAAGMNGKVCTGYYVTGKNYEKECYLIGTVDYGNSVAYNHSFRSKQQPIYGGSYRNMEA
jgi:hypothetical protein